MLRTLPTALAQHSALTDKQRAHLADLRYPELSPSQLADLGRLVEAVIKLSVPAFRSHYAPLPYEPAARALTTSQLRPENGFAPHEIAAAKEAVMQAGPARLLALYFHTTAAVRTRQTERLRLVAAQVSRATNTRILPASELAA